MKIRIEIDDELLLKAQQLSGENSIDTIVEKALKLFVVTKNQKEITSLWGNIELDDEAFK